MKQNSKILTLIVCTYDRNDILKLCLDALSLQSADRERYEVLIVNNCDKKPVLREFEEVVAAYPEVNSINETKIGLSNARNAGLGRAKSDWVGYIDDDCIAPETFVEDVLAIIDKSEYDGFGGHVKSRWMGDRPRWMSEDFGSKPLLSEAPIQLEEDYLWGGNMFFKREAVLEVGGFDINKGMHGDKIGYSEESNLQSQLRTKGQKLGYYPELVIDHLLAPYKMKLSWHLKASYAKGRDGRNAFPEQYSTKHLLKEFLRIPLIKLKSTRRLITVKNYFWENWFLDIMKPIIRLLGKLFS